MQPSNRIIANSLAMYVRTILNLLLSLYSVRLVLEILGESDYGIYMLVGGVVSMLSVFSSSLTGSTQRFLSVGRGAGDTENMKAIFRDSLLVHLVTGLMVLVILEVITPFLFNGFLNIPADRLGVASVLYQIVVVMVFITFSGAPYRALTVAHENIIFASSIDVAIGVVKVALVLCLPFIPGDRLLTYGGIMLTLTIIEFFAYFIHDHILYEECTLPRPGRFNAGYARRLGAFTGWLTYNQVSVTVRNQGLAVILNRFMGTIVNAAYGLSLQIGTMMNLIATSMANAISPQMMAAEGAGDRKRMWFLAALQSKFSFLLIAMVGIPTMFAMNPLLELWLGKGNVPRYTTLFGCMFVIMQMVDTYGIGLFNAGKAMGKVRKFIIWISTPNFLILPVCWLALFLDFPLWSVAALMIIASILYTWLKIPALSDSEGFDARSYCRNVIIKTLLPAIAGILGCIVWLQIPQFPAGFLLAYLISIPMFIAAAYAYSLSIEERNKVKSIISKFIA